MPDGRKDRQEHAGAVQGFDIKPFPGWENAGYKLQMVVPLILTRIKPRFNNQPRIKLGFKGGYIWFYADLKRTKD